MLPERGGWFDQPLAVLVQLMAIETVYQARKTIERGDEKRERAPGTARVRGGLGALSASEETLYLWLTSM